MLTCQDVLLTLFFGLRADVHFCRRGHLKQLAVQGSVYVLVCGSAGQAEKGVKRKEGFEGKTAEYSRSLRDALLMVG
jgi:hypothetical protein